MKALMENRKTGRVHCPMCTHTVEADLELRGKRLRVATGQKCPRCRASLDVAVIVQVPEAA